MAQNRVILNHREFCPERDGEEVCVKFYLRELDPEERILVKRRNRRRDYSPPYYCKERYVCSHGEHCETVREDPDVCPVFQQFRYAVLLE